MEGSDWIVPAAGAIGVPLIIGWLKGVVEKGDHAQQKVLDTLVDDVKKLRDEVSNKATLSDMQKDFDKGEVKFDQILSEIKSVGAKVNDLNTLVLTELGKRPTREEVHALFQQRHDG